MKRHLGLVGFCVLAACSNPLEKVDRLEDVRLAEPVGDAPTTASVAASPAELERRPGLFGLLRNDPKPTPQPTASVAVDAAVQAAAQEGTAAPAAAELQAPIVAEVAPAAPEKRGLFGRLAARVAPPEDSIAPSSAVPQASSAPEPVEAPVQLAGIRPRIDKPTRTTKRRGLLGPRVPKIDPNAPDAQLVSYGTAIPYGQIARVCDVPRGSLGKEIGRYPDRNPVYKLYDSKPSQTGQRTHYITGFGDGCARQFTAALALFGNPEIHEQLRYGLPSKVQPYSRTDEAYETVKGRVCRAAKSKPCGAKMDKLAKDTVFVSTYERFVGSPVWANMLLHDGRVIEKDQHRR